MPWKANDTRSRMVTSAALLLREHGVSGTSFAKVLAHSGAPRGSIGHHFPGGKSELVVDAVRFAGDAAGGAIQNAADRGDSPSELFARMCDFYRGALVNSGYAASCPIAAAAQEGHGDEELRTVAAEVFAGWRTTLAQTLAETQGSPEEAEDLAELCIASLEGALMLARVQRSTGPIDRVQRRMEALLSTG